MNVYFNENYWGCLSKKSSDRPGRALQCRASFSWEDRTWQVLGVYLCQEGLVADFCSRVSRQEILDFYEKGGEQDNPFYMDFWMEAEVGGILLQRQAGCGCSYRPADWIPLEEAREAGKDSAEEMLMETYGLDLTAGWRFWRQSFAWAEGIPQEMSSVVFTFYKEPVDLPGPHFWTGRTETKRELEFVHPVTGNVHKLTVLGQKQEVLSIKEFPPEMEIRQFPEHYVVLDYQVEPELSAEALLVSDCSLSDSPTRRDTPAASSVAVIGGADGPTSIFLAGKVSEPAGEPSRKKAYSALHYEPADRVEWKLTFRVKDDRKARVHLNI